MAIKPKNCETEAKIIQVIHVNRKRGNGTHDNPTRLVDIYFSLDGRHLAEQDCVDWEKHSEEL